MKRHVSHLVLFLVLIGLLPAQAFYSDQNYVQTNASQELPYYGEDFYRSLQQSQKDDELKGIIKRVLKSGHISVPGQLDRLVDDCSGRGEKCYSQISLGYDRARQFLMGYLYLTQDNEGYGVREFYCDRIYTEKEFGPKAGPGPQKIPDNNIVNVEHTWPQSRFNPSHAKNLQKADLHHLYPTDNQLNSIRGNNRFGEVTRDRQNIKCPGARSGTGGDDKGDIFEPPDNHKGRVARALFYFSLRYDLQITPSEEQFLRKWHNEHPVTEDEVVRNNEVYKAQGNRNPFIDYPELVSSISNF